MSPKMTLALPGGALSVLGVHLQIFPVNYTYIFSPPWGYRCTHCNPWLCLWQRGCGSGQS